MDTPLKQFSDALNAQEDTFIPKLASDNLGLILRSAVNELDWYYYNFIRTENPTFEQEEQFYLLRMGVVRLIKLALDARPSFDVPTVMFRRTRNITVPVLEMVAVHWAVNARSDTRCHAGTLYQAAQGRWPVTQDHQPRVGTGQTDTQSGLAQLAGR